MPRDCIRLNMKNRNHFGKSKVVKDIVSQAADALKDIEFKGRWPERTKRQFISKLLTPRKRGRPID